MRVVTPITLWVTYIDRLITNAFHLDSSLDERCLTIAKGIVESLNQLGPLESIMRVPGYRPWFFEEPTCLSQRDANRKNSTEHFQAYAAMESFRYHNDLVMRLSEAKLQRASYTSWVVTPR